MTDTEITVPRTRCVSTWWRFLSVVLLIALLLGWATGASMYAQFETQIEHIKKKIDDVPQVRFIAVLQDKDAQTAMLVTMNRKAKVLQVQRLNEVKEGREDSMQLWALKEGQPPRSLGVIESKLQTLEMPAQEIQLQGITELAISVEKKGGVPEANGPALPWLFKGALVQKAL